jgi:hypothetical protein
MYRSYTEKDYNDFYEQLMKLLPDPEHPFRLYYNKNWHQSRLKWVPYGRARSAHFGVRTTNHVESHNSVLSKELNRRKTLKETLKSMMIIYSDRATTLRHNQHVIRTKVPNYHGPETVTSKLLLGTATDFCIELLQKQEKYSESVSPSTLSKYKTSLLDCSCTFFKGCLLPCRHIMYMRRQMSVEVLKIDDVPARWTLKHQLNEGGVEISATALGGGEASRTFRVTTSRSALSKEAKFNKVMKECKDICDLMSNMGGKDFEEAFISMTHVKSMLTQEAGFKVVSRGKFICMKYKYYTFQSNCAYLQVVQRKHIYLHLLRTPLHLSFRLVMVMIYHHLH